MMRNVFIIAVLPCDENGRQDGDPEDPDPDSGDHTEDAQAPDAPRNQGRLKVAQHS